MMSNPRRITDRIYALHLGVGVLPWGSLAYAVLHPRSGRVLLIDSGGPGNGRRLARMLSQIGRSLADLAAVALTHWHPDHSGSIAELLDAAPQKVTVYGSEHDLDAYLAQRRRPLRSRPLFGLPGGLVVHLAPGRVSDRQDISYVRLDRNAGEELMAEWGLSAILTPGHTPGHMAYYLPADRALFCGDALKVLGKDVYTLLFHDDLQQMDLTGRQLLERKFDWLLPGHWSPIRVCGLRTQPRPYIRLIEWLGGLCYQATVETGKRDG